MKNLAALLLFCLFLSSVSYSQINKTSDSQKLNQQVALLYQQGKIGEAVVLAEKIVEIQRKNNNQDWQNLAVALKNLVILQKQHDEILIREVRDPKFSERERNDKRVILSKYYDSIPVLFEEVIEVYTKKLKTENLSLAEIKAEYAAYLSASQGKYPGMGSTDPEKTEKLFEQALSIRKRYLGENDDLTLSTIQQIANFYQNDAKFEKSVPYYRLLIKEIENKYGKNSAYLLTPLRVNAKILRAVNDQVQSEVIEKQISDITGKAEPLAEFDLDLTLRNEKNKSAELMENPNTITSYLKKEKFLRVEVLIDEKGKAIEIKPGATTDKNINGKYVQQQAEKDIKEWKFKPLIFNGTLKKVRGII